MVKRPLGLKISQSRNGCLGTKAPFFCDYVRRYLMADRALGRTPADRAQLINSGGLTIKTTSTSTSSGPRTWRPRSR